MGLDTKTYWPTDRQSESDSDSDVGCKKRKIYTNWRETGESGIMSTPRGGGLEYLHRSPASRKATERETNLIWEIYIWCRAMCDLDPRVTSLAKPRSTCTSNLLTRSLVREGAPYLRMQMSEDSFLRSEIKLLSRVPDGGLIPGQTVRLAVGRKIGLTLTWTWVIQWLRLAETPNKAGVYFHLRTETDSVSETLFCSF
jgi:hypothetical protein